MAVVDFQWSCSAPWWNFLRITGIKCKCSTGIMGNWCLFVCFFLLHEESRDRPKLSLFVFFLGGGVNQSCLVEKPQHCTTCQSVHLFPDVVWWVRWRVRWRVRFKAPSLWAQHLLDRAPPAEGSGPTKWSSSWLWQERSLVWGTCGGFLICATKTVEVRFPVQNKTTK